MADQNKKPLMGKNISSREDELRKDLEQVFDSKKVAEGHEVISATNWDITATQRQRELFVKQGTRMRHPDKVLHQFRTIVGDNGKHTREEYLRMFEDETERAELPAEYEYQPDEGMVASQMGVAKLAHGSFKKSNTEEGKIMNKLYNHGF